jgi:hypothetical protein
MAKHLLLAIAFLAGCAAVSPPRNRLASRAAHRALPTTPATSLPPETEPRVVDGFDCTALERSAPRCDAPDQGDWQSRYRQKDNRELIGRVLCAPAPTAQARTPRWDHLATPDQLARIEQRYGLTTSERAHLFRDGLVVSPRLEYDDYAIALHDVYKSQLPIYVSVDSILHAIYASNDKLIASIEHDTLAPRLRTILGDMRDALRKHAATYAIDTARDADVLLTVAHRLLDPDAKEVVSVLGVDAEIDSLIARVNAAGGLERLRLFGRDRTMDMGQFRPRGHYAPGAAEKYGWDLSSFFRAAMWLSRIEMNLVTRSSRSSSADFDEAETPREAKLAMVLTDLAGKAGVLDELARVEAVWSLLAGPREDVSPAALTKLMKTAGITDPTSDSAPAALKAAIGNGFQRTARIHVQAEGSTMLPVIATVLGPRIAPDLPATRPLVHGEIPMRFEVTAADVAYFLGHDRALTHASTQLALFPQLRPRLDRARQIVSEAANGREDLYASWLAAIRGLAEKPAGVTPSFMDTDAFRDMRIGSAIAAYGQLRHNYVLYVPITYDESGCEIPDGWVEPAPAVYRALIQYAERGARVLQPLDVRHASFFARLATVLKALSRIADRELAGEPLRDEEKIFLASIMERADPNPRGGAPGYEARPARNGWYYDLFLDPNDALNGAKLVADHFASVNAGTVDYAGVAAVRMGFFVIDTGSAPRVMVGPVARAFSAKGPIAPRYSDTDVGNFPIADPWAASYTATRVAAPAMVSTLSRDEQGVYTVEVSGNVGTVTITLLDHHGAPAAAATADVRGKQARIAFDPSGFTFSDPAVKHLGIEAVRFQAGDFIHIENTWYEDKRLVFGTDRAPWQPPPNPRLHVGRPRRF